MTAVRALRPCDDTEIAGIRADLELALFRMARLLKRHDISHPLYGHVEAAHAMLNDELLSGHWFLAEQAAEE